MKEDTYVSNTFKNPLLGDSLDGWDLGDVLGVDSSLADDIIADAFNGQFAEHQCSECGSNYSKSERNNSLFCSDMCTETNEDVMTERAKAVFPMVMRWGYLGRAGDPTEQDLEDGRAYLTAAARLVQDWLNEDAKVGRSLPPLLARFRDQVVEAQDKQRSEGTRARV